MGKIKYYVTLMGLVNENNIRWMDYITTDLDNRKGINNFLNEIKAKYNLKSCFIINVIPLKE